MEKLIDQGLTKSIGVSNYNVQSLLTILSDCRIKPAFNEIEFHIIELKKFRETAIIKPKKKTYQIPKI